MTPPIDEPLRRLADAWGVQTSYEDASGILQTADPDVLATVLAALGVQITGPGEAAEALEATRRARWDTALEPVVVARVGEPFDVVLRPSTVHGDEPLQITVRPESGDEPVTVRTIPAAASVDDGPVELRVPVEVNLEIGYHELAVAYDGQEHQALLMVRPATMHRPAGPLREWGAFLPLHAVRTEHDRGVGDLGDLGAFADLVGRHGGTIAATLPLLPTYLDDRPPAGPGEDTRFDPSPYAPVSRLMWNELHVDLTSAPELDASPAAQKLLASRGFQDELARLRRRPLVDHNGASRVVDQVLRLLAVAMTERRQDEFQQFLDQHPLVAEYARFRGAVTRRDERWWTWPAAAREGAPTDADVDGASQRVHAYAQWLMHEQVGALSRRLRDRGEHVYLDLPVGSRRDGFDAWRFNDVFALGVDAGAPPDALFSGGQNWQFPPLHPQRLREHGYGYLREVLAHHLRVADLLRIDHVMGLHRLYWIPEGVPPTAGVYVRYPADELYAVLAIESHRARSLIIGENLGTVPAEINRALADNGVLGMYVGQYELDGDADRPLRPVPEGSVASVNTHDMPPFAAFVEGRDIDDRVDLGLIDDEAAASEHRARGDLLRRLARQLADDGHVAPGTPYDDPVAVHSGLVDYLGSGPAGVVLVNLEDLWGETHQQNVPGTLHERPNWRHRSRHTLEAIAASSALRPLERLTDLRPTKEDTMSTKKSKTAPSKVVPVAEPTSRAEPEQRESPGVELTDFDLHLFNEGSHTRMYDKLGAHLTEKGGKTGAHFGVWAPNAEAVSVIGDFNDWDKQADPLEPVGSSGIWAGFVPGPEQGQTYKFHIESRHQGYKVDKADPYAVHTETPPKTGSKLWDLSYEWGDEDWMASRGDRQKLDQPISIYEVHLGSWRRGEDNRPLTYRELADQLVGHVTHLGFTHVEFLPVMEHPFGGSWGYQTTGYFAPTSRFGTPQDFMYLVDQLHQAGIGVILDWVPSHFPSDELGLAYFDGTHLYEHADPRKGYHPDWNSYIFNYGRDEVRSFLMSSAMSWLDRYHIDGIRVDAVASMLYLDYSRKDGEWIPNEYGGNENVEAIEFLRRLNTEIYDRYPDVQTFAEESTAWPMVSRPTYLGGLGFGYKWDMGWMHDTLEYFSQDPVHRKYHHNELTFRAIYAFSENYCLPLSHDEVVHGKGSMIGKMPGDDWQQFANLRLLYGYQFVTPGKKLLFMGGEFGQRREWNHESSLDWHLLDEYGWHAQLQDFVAAAARLYHDEPALHSQDCDPWGFEWIDASDWEQSIIAFRRVGRDGSSVIVVGNFTPVVRTNYRIGVPHGGFWRELLNSDATDFGGSGAGNYGGVKAAPAPFHGRNYSVNLTLPPLGLLVLKGEPGRETVEG